MQNLKTLTLSLLIGLTLAGGITYAAWATNVWNPTDDWIADGEVISAQKIAENFEYLLGLGGDECTEHNTEATRYNVTDDSFEYCNGSTWESTVTPCAVASGSLESFTSPGIHTWTKPAGECGSVTVECWGAGGGGSRNHKGSAGGGGGYQTKTILFVNLATTETIVVGVGGNGVASHSGAGNGGNSRFGLHMTAYGGKGGQLYMQAGGGLPSDGYNYGGGNGASKYGSAPINSVYGGGGGGAYGSAYPSGGTSTYGGYGGVAYSGSWQGSGGGGGYGDGHDGSASSSGNGGNGACLITVDAG